MRRAIAAALLSLLLGAAARAQDAALDGWAKSLIDGLLDRQSSGDRLGDAWRVALWPIQGPVRPPLAQVLDRELANALAKAGGDRIRFLDRARLEVILAGLPGGTAGAENPVGALRGKSPIDVVIRPQLDIVGDGSQRVTAQAILLNDGALLASADTTVHPPADAGDCGAIYDTVDSALDQAARAFADRLPDGSRLRLCGITVANGPVGSEFGDWLDGRLRVALGATARRPALTAGCGAPSAAAGNELTGTYWMMKSGIDLRLELRDAAGGYVARQACLPPGAVDPSLDPRPRGKLPASLVEDVRPGTIAVRLTSDRGTRPTYVDGDTMRLFMSLSEPAWIWCFYRDAADTTYTLLPYDATRRSVRLEAGVDRPLLGTVTMQKPFGIELLKCFASREDVGPLLPAEIRNSLPPRPGAAVTRPLPAPYDLSFPEAFRRLAGDVTEASLVIQVVAKGASP